MNDSASGPGKKPLAVYAIIDRKDKSHWIKIGSAFSNRDGSTNVYLDALPIGTNRLQIREPRAREDARASNGSDAPTPDLGPEGQP